MLAGQLRRFAAIKGEAGGLDLSAVDADQRPRASTVSPSDRPSGVSASSARGGLVGVTVRSTRPSRSRLRSVRVSMRCEIPPTRRLISLKRRGPPLSRTTMRMLHLSPTRARMAVIARHSSDA